MNNKGTGTRFGIGVAVLAVIYSVLVFFLKKEFNLSAWILYVFTLLAFLCLCLQIVAAAHEKQNAVFTAVTVIAALIYWAVQFVFGGIICMHYEILKPGVVLAAEMILLVLYLIIIFVLNSAHGHAQRQDIADRNAVIHVRKLESDVKDLSDKQHNPEIKRKLDELAENLHYLDVFEHIDLEEQDKTISEGIARIRYRLEDGNEEIEDLIADVRGAIKERDRRAAILKQ